MKGYDEITLTVLDDGMAKLDTDDISGANHTSADRIVDHFARLLGGTPTIEQKRKHGHTHTHGTHTHTHDA